MATQQMPTYAWKLLGDGTPCPKAVCSIFGWLWSRVRHSEHISLISTHRVYFLSSPLNKTRLKRSDLAKVTKYPSCLPWVFCSLGWTLLAYSIITQRPKFKPQVCCLLSIYNMDKLFNLLESTLASIKWRQYCSLGFWWGLEIMCSKVLGWHLHRAENDSTVAIMVIMAGIWIPTWYKLLSSERATFCL